MYNIIDALVNAKLIDLGNCVDMVWLHFKSEDDLYCLHVQANWMLYQKKILYCSRDDMFIDAGNNMIYKNYFTEYEMHNSIFKSKTEMIKKAYLPLQVRKVSIHQDNTITIELYNDFFFVVENEKRENEMWRFFKKGDYSQPHIVAYFNRVVEE